MFPQLHKISNNPRSRGASLVAQMVKTRDVGDLGLIPGLRRSHGRGHKNPLQYSCLENPMDRGAWRTDYSPLSHKELNVTV